MNDAQQALQRYNSLFDNTRYQAVAYDLALDLDTNRDDLRVSDPMNLLTDACLALCGHPHPPYAEAWVKLAAFCGQNSVGAATIALMQQHMQVFAQVYDTRPDDFGLTAHALLKSYAASDPLQTALSCANGVHGWRGRMAYHLLSAADYLVQAALNLLAHNSLSYISEKLRHGLQHITWGLSEGVQHSGQPERFHFSKTDLPSV